MTYIVLSNNQMVRVPAGADPDFVRHVAENALQIKAKPKRKRRRSTCGSRRRRGRKASQIQAEYLAMAKLVDRANESEAG